LIIYVKTILSYQFSQYKKLQKCNNEFVLVKN